MSKANKEIPKSEPKIEKNSLIKLIFAGSIIAYAIFAIFLEYYSSNGDIDIYGILRDQVNFLALEVILCLCYVAIYFKIVSCLH